MQALRTLLRTLQDRFFGRRGHLDIQALQRLLLELNLQESEGFCVEPCDDRIPLMCNRNWLLLLRLSRVEDNPVENPPWLIEHLRANAAASKEKPSGQTVSCTLIPPWSLDSAGLLLVSRVVEVPNNPPCVLHRLKRAATEFSEAALNAVQEELLAMPTPVALASFCTTSAGLQDYLFESFNAPGEELRKDLMMEVGHRLSEYMPALVAMPSFQQGMTTLREGSPFWVSPVSAQLLGRNLAVMLLRLSDTHLAVLTLDPLITQEADGIINQLQAKLMRVQNELRGLRSNLQEDYTAFIYSVVDVVQECLLAVDEALPCEQKDQLGSAITQSQDVLGKLQRFCNAALMPNRAELSDIESLVSNVLMAVQIQNPDLVLSSSLTGMHRINPDVFTSFLRYLVTGAVMDPNVGKIELYGETEFIQTRICVRCLSKSEAPLTLLSDGEAATWTDLTWDVAANNFDLAIARQLTARMQAQLQFLRPSAQEIIIAISVGPAES